MVDKRVLHMSSPHIVRNERWFGVVKRKNGKFFYGFDFVKECPTQVSFVEKKLKPDKGDMVVELFKNSLLDPDDFKSYYREFYLGEAPVFVPLEHATKKE